MEISFKKYPYKGVKAATANAGIIAEKSIWAAEGLLAIIITPVSYTHLTLPTSDLV